MGAHSTQWRPGTLHLPTHLMTHLRTHSAKAKEVVPTHLMAHLRTHSAKAEEVVPTHLMAHPGLMHSLYSPCRCYNHA